VGAAGDREDEESKGRGGDERNLYKRDHVNFIGQD
jgi:hypothetical protein